MFRVQELAELLDVLVVMPGMPLFGFWTDWWNHGRQGPPRVRTYFLREVVPLVERDYGAGTRRAAAGESQGGFGALGFTARIPVCSARWPPSGPRCIRSGTPRCGCPARNSWEWTVKPSSGTRGSSGRYGWTGPVPPRRGPAPHARLPRLRRRAPGPLDGEGPDPRIPGTEKWVVLADDDVVSTEAVCAEETRMLSARLKSLNTPVTTHIYPGTHTGTYGYRELRHALPMLLTALHGRPRPRGDPAPRETVPRRASVSRGDGDIAAALLAAPPHRRAGLRGVFQARRRRQSEVAGFRGRPFPPGGPGTRRARSGPCPAGESSRAVRIRKRRGTAPRAPCREHAARPPPGAGGGRRCQPVPAAGAKGPCRAAHCRSMMVLPSAMRPSRVMARASVKGSSRTSMSSPSSSTPPPVPVRSAGV